MFVSALSYRSKCLARLVWKPRFRKEKVVLGLFSSTSQAGVSAHLGSVQCGNKTSSSSPVHRMCSFFLSFFLSQDKPEQKSSCLAVPGRGAVSEHAGVIGGVMRASFKLTLLKQQCYF